MLRIFIDDIELSQDQLDAITPILNYPFAKDTFKERCLSAMEMAGCPLHTDEADAKQTLSLNHNQLSHMNKLIVDKVRFLDAMLESDMKAGFESKDIISMQSEKTELQNILTQIAEG